MGLISSVMEKLQVLAQYPTPLNLLRRNSSDLIQHVLKFSFNGMLSEKKSSYDRVTVATRRINGAANN